MKEPRKSLGAGAIASLPIACCLGLPLLVAAGVGTAALVWGAGVIAALALAATAVVVLARRRARGGRAAGAAARRGEA
jgi:hypothetical protein